MATKTMTAGIAASIATQLRARGFDGVDAQTVQDFARTGSVDESVVGPEYDSALESAILQACDEYGIEV